MSVTSDFLLKGYALALEQCGLLLRAAVLLYKDKSYSNAVVLAAFAREELGRAQILLDLWRQRLGGSPVTTDDIEKACEDHVAKQRAGMRALYVEPKSCSDWNRPADVSAMDAHRFLQDAVNDYANRYHQGYIVSDQPLKHIDQGLYDALDRLTGRPRLPPPQWPPYPVTVRTTTVHFGPDAIAAAVVVAVTLVAAILFKLWMMKVLF